MLISYSAEHEMKAAFAEHFPRLQNTSIKDLKSLVEFNRANADKALQEVEALRTSLDEQGKFWL